MYYPLHSVGECKCSHCLHPSLHPLQGPLSSFLSVLLFPQCTQTPTQAVNPIFLYYLITYLQLYQKVIDHIREEWVLWYNQYTMSLTAAQLEVMSSLFLSMLKRKKRHSVVSLYAYLAQSLKPEMKLENEDADILSESSIYSVLLSPLEITLTQYADSEVLIPPIKSAFRHILLLFGDLSKSFLLQAIEILWNSKLV